MDPSKSHEEMFEEIKRQGAEAMKRLSEIFDSDRPEEAVDFVFDYAEQSQLHFTSIALLLVTYQVHAVQSLMEEQGLPTDVTVVPEGGGEGEPVTPTTIIGRLIAQGLNDDRHGLAGTLIGLARAADPEMLSPVLGNLTHAAYGAHKRFPEEYQ